MKCFCLWCVSYVSILLEFAWLNYYYGKSVDALYFYHFSVFNFEISVFMSSYDKWCFFPIHKMQWHHFLNPNCGIYWTFHLPQKQESIGKSIVNDTFGNYPGGTTDKECFTDLGVAWSSICANAYQHLLLSTTVLLLKFSTFS